MDIRFDGRVAIVTGAGGGLGRCHALGLAARGAKVVVNDLGPGGAPSASAQARRRPRSRPPAAPRWPTAPTSPTPHQVAAMVAAAEAAWGRVDILVNNAGILRDKSFAKMELADFEKVVDVHLMGSAICTKAVWNGMRERNYGRIVFTSSSSGLYGNFGQANYGAAKAAMVGLMNVLHLEGAKNNIRVNTLAPTARTAMTESLLPRRRRRADVAGIGDAGPAVPGQRERALAGDPRRRRRRFRGDPYRRDAGRLSARRRAHAGDDRRALRRDRRPRHRRAARQRVRPDVQVRFDGARRPRRDPV